MIRFLRPIDPHKIRLLVFDLDGTLIDSRLDLVHSVNAMLRHFHRPELPEELIASYVGDGAPALVRRALGDSVDEGEAPRHHALHDEGDIRCAKALVGRRQSRREQSVGRHRIGKPR